MFPLSFKAGGFKKHSPDQDARAEDARLLSVTWRRKGWLRWQLGQSRLSERRDVVMGYMCCAHEGGGGRNWEDWAGGHLLSRDNDDTHI